MPECWITVSNDKGWTEFAGYVPMATQEVILQVIKGDVMQSQMAVYVYVIHKVTRRAFGLNRVYDLVEKDIQDVDARVGLIRQSEGSPWDGWFPTRKAQSPDWAKGFKESEFEAVWDQDVR